KGINVVFKKDNLTETLGEVLEKHHKTQIRIAETEKYPHVTFFFSGGREEPFEGESRILRNSPKVATYDLKPEMSAYELRDALIPELQKGEVDFVCLNFANGDMVGHTGVMEAVIKSVEAVDDGLGKLIPVIDELEGVAVIIADHGNADEMFTEKNGVRTPKTSHTLNPVPCIIYDPSFKGEYKMADVKTPGLTNIAGTLLNLLGYQNVEDYDKSLIEIL
ncbi:MAG: alkaline phosphatase family protein, partial [Ignavibacteriae bacterium]|nr:alkaline phosphatase family protein [Ignavibacteriota bacterium]